MKKKKVKRCKKTDDCCDVMHCGRDVHVAWNCQGTRRKICKYHFKRHCNENDEFSLFPIFGIPQMRLNVESGKFSMLGKPLPHDYDEMRELSEKCRIIEGGAKKEDSIERLKKWKAENGNTKRKRKRKPPPPRPTERDRQTEFDDIVGNILGD